jgi:hypothetical protein
MHSSLDEHLYEINFYTKPTFFLWERVKWGIRKKLRYLFLESNDGGLVVSSIES